MGPPRRAQRAGRARPAVHRPPPGPRGHQPAGLRRHPAGGSARAATRPHRGHRRSQRAHGGHRPAGGGPDLGAGSSRCSPPTRPSSASPTTAWAIPNQGIVHVIGPEQGRTLPGMTIVCGDSHTSTHGAFGALAFGIGTSEVEHVLATQTLPQVRPGTMAVTVTGTAPRRLHRQGRHPRHHRPHRHGRGHRLGHRVPRRHDRRPLHGGPDDDLQHVDRGGRQGGPDRTRRRHVRLPRGPHPRPERRRAGKPRSTTGAPFPPTTAPPSTGRCTSTPPASGRTCPGAPTPRRSCRWRGRSPRPTTSPTRTSATAPRGPSSTWASPPAPRCETCRSTRCSSAAAPTRGSRTCGPRPRWRRAVR